MTERELPLSFDPLRLLYVGCCAVCRREVWVPWEKASFLPGRASPRVVVHNCRI